MTLVRTALRRTWVPAAAKIPWPSFERLRAMRGAAAASSIQQAANRRNLLLLVTLRWLAVAGQVATIILVRAWLGVPLPLMPMAVVLLFLVALNLASLYRCRTGPPISGLELFTGLLLDVAALTVQLYLSGGATNPFISLFLLQVILGAVLLRPAPTWILLGFASVSFVWLMGHYRPLDLTAYAGAERGLPDDFQLHTYGLFICFLLAAGLLVLFVTRITRNLSDRDDRLATLRQQSAEEEHIVRMGLLASGAAHELGTPLSTLSVIVNDWEHVPALRGDRALAEEMTEMQAALARCKEIVSRVLLAAGEARGEDCERTTLLDFLDEVVGEWRESRAAPRVDYTTELGPDTPIASDTVLRQIFHNVFDNAFEASPDWVGIHAERRGEMLTITVRDRGQGFAPSVLADLGKPYNSTKGRPGRGLGLFLVVNVLRKLGGAVQARNHREGGAVVELSIPIDALAVQGDA
jgi:two-component system sensor histidine kinase RegB